MRDLVISRKSLFAVLYFSLICSFSLLKADTITVYNETADKTLYFATYRKKSDKIERVSGPVSVSQGSKRDIARPEYKFRWDRKLLFSTNQASLKSSLSASAYNATPHISIGKAQGSKFYLAWDGKRYVGYNSVEWVIKKKIIEKIKEEARKLAEKIKEEARKLAEKIDIPGIFKTEKDLFKLVVDLAQGKFKPKDEYYNQVAYTRRGSAISSQEVTFLQQRTAKVKKQLETVLSKKYGKEYSSLAKGEVPTIGLCFSGGGYRAMFATVGYLQGLHKIGVLSASTYMAGLSGSTWALAPWVVSNKKPIDRFAPSFFNKVTVAQRGGEVKEALKKTFASNSKKDLLNFAKLVLTKKTYGQSVALVDYFGFTVGNPLLKGYRGKNFFEHGLSDLQRNIAGGRFPMPIFVCNEQPVKGATWFEFNPYEFGSHSYQSYIPAWSLGRSFVKGKSIDRDPEQTLAYILGICGSGFAYSLMAVMPEVVSKIADIFPYILKIKEIKIVRDLSNDINRFKKETALGKKLSRPERVKFGAARIPNQNYKLSGAPYRGQRILQLSDGGQVVFMLKNMEVITHNFASVPLLKPERSVDIMIMCDADRNGVEGKHLLASVMQAEKEKGRLKQFPAIDYKKIDSPVVSVFKDEKTLSKPVTIFAACVPDKGYANGYDPSKEDFTGTFNFAWLKHEAAKHSGLAKHIITKKESKRAIWQAIKWWIDTKRGKKNVRRH